ncbi:unnamed protein product [Pleuronectes platessa]|uniref:Uncharacterized protein n=1 Tax=Pleuronectes platessa TaxID=8262 RepID=A0A9N7VYN8_PLEPL|nr:unnamed protein product [Pleuronectes platessa]
MLRVDPAGSLMRAALVGIGHNKLPARRRAAPGKHRTEPRVEKPASRSLSPRAKRWKSAAKSTQAWQRSRIPDQMWTLTSIRAPRRRIHEAPLSSGMADWARGSEDAPVDPCLTRH